MASRTPWVAIVTPIHNGIRHTVAFLESVRKDDYRNKKVLIIDDGSTDKSGNIIRSKFPEVIVLEGNGSLWWSGATNKGVVEALELGVDFIYTVNNDVVLDSGCIGKSVECAMKSKRSIIGSKVNYIDDPGRVWFYGAKFDEVTGDISLVNGRDYDFIKPAEADMLTGMGMLIPVEVFREIGLFDQKSFPQYFADSDLSLRAKKIGYKLVMCPESKIYNDVDSAWSARKIGEGKISTVPSLLFSFRSPLSIQKRFIFYRRHWGKGYMRALFRFYVRWMSNFLLPYTKSVFRRKLWRKP